MAYRLTHATTTLTRTTGLVSSSSDYTCILTIQPLSVATSTDYRTAFVLTNVDDSRYIGIFSDGSGNDFRLELDAGAGNQVSTSVFIGANSTRALAYIRKDDTHYFYRRSTTSTGAVLVGTITADVAAITFTDLLVGNDGASITNLDVSYFREWSRALTNNELLMELNGSLHTFDGDLETDCPILANLTDTSGNGNTFSVLGTAGAFVNNIPATSVDITGETFPFTYTVTPAEFNVSEAIWFTFTSSVGQLLGASVTTPPDDYDIFFYTSDGTSVIVESDFNPLNAPIAEGVYYIQILGFDPISADFDVNFERLAMVESLPGCTTIINDDKPGYGAITFNPQTGAFEGYVAAFPTGELAAVLPNGISLWHDRFLNYHDEYLVLLDDDFTLLASVDTTPSIGGGENPACIANTDTDFYVLRVADNKVWKVTSAGVISDTGATVVPHSGDVTSIGVNADGDVLYWTEGVDSPYAVYAWDLDGNVELPTLYTTLIGSGYLGLTPINANNGDILVLDNGNVLVAGQDTGDSFSTLYYVSAAGALLDFFEFSGTYFLINHLAYAGGNIVYVWLYDTDGALGRFVSVDVTTAVVTTIFDTSLFTAGLSNASGLFQSIGPSSSCQMVIYQNEVCDFVPPTPGEIIVEKITSPPSGTIFTFTAGGMTPAEFTLSHGESQTFDDLTPGDGYSIVEHPDASYTAAYSVSNGSPISAISVDAGETVTVTVTNTSPYLGFATTLPIRWVRVTPILSQENLTIFLSKLTLDIQTGVGITTGQGSEPVVMFRYSIDSGYTWSNLQELPIGRMGQYLARVLIWQLGSGRNWVFEFSGSDPVILGLLDLYFEGTPGSH